MKREKSLKFIRIRNTKQCLYPNELENDRYKKIVFSNFEYNDQKTYFYFNDTLYFEDGGDLQMWDITNPRYS